MSWQPTDTVLAIIRDMRERQDFSALPILADALQDCDYPDETVLALFRRDGDILPVRRDRILCTIMGGEYASAVKRIEKIAEELGDSYGYGSDEEGLLIQPMNYQVIMRAADAWIRDKESGRWGEYLTQQGQENWRNDFPQMAEEFWNNYEVVTGKSVEDKQDSFFSCSC